MGTRQDFLKKCGYLKDPDSHLRNNYLIDPGKILGNRAIA